MFDQLPKRTPAQLFAFAGSVDDFHGVAVAVVAITGNVAHRVGGGDAVTALIVLIVPAVVGGVGLNQR